MAARAGLEAIMSDTSEPGYDVTASHAPRITAVSIMLMALSGVVVGLRFLARRLSQAGLWWDDWTILVALILSWGPCISMLIAVSDGFGRHMNAIGGPSIAEQFELRLEMAVEWFQLLYAFSTLYTFAITLAKYSILLFYSRIFKEKKFLIALRVVFALVTLWFIAIQIVVFAECVPVQALWDRNVDGTCINFAAFYQGSGIPNVVFNTTILLLPLPMIWSLEIEKRHKIALSGVFLLGSFVVIVSIIRLVFIAQIPFPPRDITWTFVDGGIWTAIEPCVAVISASLPILRSLWIWNRRKRTERRATDGTSSNGDVKIPSYKPHHSRGRTNTKKGGSMSSGHYPLNDLPAGAQHAWGNHVAIYAATPSGKSSGDADSYADLPIMHPARAVIKPPPKPPTRPQVSELYGS